MKRKITMAVCIALVFALIVGMYTTVWASSATYLHSGFKNGYVGTSTASKTSGQQGFDYNEYAKDTVSNANVTYYSRICNSSGNSLGSFKINTSGGNNKFETSYAGTIKIELKNNSSRWGQKYTKIKGKFGGTG